MSVRNLKRSLTFSVTGALLLSAAACGNDNVRDEEKPVGQPLTDDPGTSSLPEEQPDGQLRPISNPAPVVPTPVVPTPAEDSDDDGTAKTDDDADAGSTQAPRPVYINTRPSDVNDAPPKL